MKGLKRLLAGIFYGLTGLLVFLLALIGFAANWAFTTWGDIDMDEIVFHLQQPLEGTGNGMIGDYLLKGLLPAVLVLAVYIVLLILLKKGKRRLVCCGIFLGLSVLAAVFIRGQIWTRLDMDTWLSGRRNASSFIEDHYADPASVKIDFPAKKRNLIYIYLESMETTFSDEESGGAFPYNTIPELTEIAKQNEDFSGASEGLNGGVVLPGTAFTTGAMFAQTAGLPLKLSIGGNFMDTQSAFFPNLMALGDLLEQAGYRQVFLLGSDATFGGRRLYFHDHGDAEIRDFLYAKEQGWIPPYYEVFWGYEDEKLFSFAKETVQELAAGEQPFALTLLTVDTHYEDGYVCRLCGHEFGENQYANVFACSSRQTAAFLAWLRQQDFYANTTVVLCGDHTTMDTNFCDDVPESYQRKTYTAFVNAAASCADPDKERLYSTMDFFPTTVAALGAKIEGERLGLGTNLFSKEETLLEQMGKDALTKELSRRSPFLEAMEKEGGADQTALLARLREVFKDSLSIDGYDAETGRLTFHVTNINFYENAADDALLMDIAKVEAVYQDSASSEETSIFLSKSRTREATYEGQLTLPKETAEESPAGNPIQQPPSGTLTINLLALGGTRYPAVTSLNVP